MNIRATERGGNGAYYDAGPGRNGIIRAGDGNFPGCGGGGGYKHGEDTSGAGENGYVTIILQDW
jgi:hypothetical protein